MVPDKSEKLIRNYVEAYNKFDIEGMLLPLHADIEFINISNGEINLTLKGIQAFKEQAESSKSIFETRHQQITSITNFDDRVEIEINYQGILACDLPNGLHKGDKIELKGRSVFRFADERIIQITDIS